MKLGIVDCHSKILFKNQITSDQTVLGLLKSKCDLKFIDVKCEASWTNLTSIKLSVLNEITITELEKKTQKNMPVVKAVSKLKKRSELPYVAKIQRRLIFPYEAWFPSIF